VEKWTPNSSAHILQEIKYLEKKIFPKHESMVDRLEVEVAKRSNVLYFVQIGKEVLGYILISNKSEFKYILKLAVSPAHRKQGIGTKLVQHVISAHGKTGKIVLHVDPSRSDAVSLYTKLGFTVSECVKDYYSAMRDAYLMQFCLTYCFRKRKRKTRRAELCGMPVK